MGSHTKANKSQPIPEKDSLCTKACLMKLISIVSSDNHIHISATQILLVLIPFLDLFTLFTFNDQYKNHLVFLHLRVYMGEKFSVCIE